MYHLEVGSKIVQKKAQPQLSSPGCEADGNGRFSVLKGDLGGAVSQGICKLDGGV